MPLHVVEWSVLYDKFGVTSQDNKGASGSFLQTLLKVSDSLSTWHKGV
jgi:hypothetical protein